MSDLDPYEKFLDGRALDTILAATPGEIARLILAVGPDKENTPPAPGKWSAAEIVAHLADCELVFAFRLRQTLSRSSRRWRSSRRCGAGTCASSFSPCRKRLSGR